MPPNLYYYQVVFQKSKLFPKCTDKAGWTLLSTYVVVVHQQFRSKYFLSVWLLISVTLCRRHKKLKPGRGVMMQFCLFHTTSNPTSSQMSWWYSRVFLQHDEIKPSQVFSRHLLHKWTFFVAFGTHIYIWVVREKEQLTLPPSPQQLVILLVHSLSKKYFSLCNNEALHFSCLTQCGASTRASQIIKARRCLTCQA